MKSKKQKTGNIAKPEDAIGRFFLVFVEQSS